MLARLDRMLLAVHDRARAADTFARLFGATLLRERDSGVLNARCSVLALGESELELWEPTAPGAIRQHLERWGEGLYAAGCATADLDALEARLLAQGARPLREGGQLHLGAADNPGLPLVLSTLAARPPVGALRFLYEATHALQTPWREVAARYARVLGLAEGGFCPIHSARFGYEGTLTLFDPARRLDRIELSQTFAAQPGAMRRFVERRGGDALYMCFAETRDFIALRQHLLAAGARISGREARIEDEGNVLWVHPRSLHGMLLGVSRETVGWEWSGHPERVVPPPASSGSPA